MSLIFPDPQPEPGGVYRMVNGHVAEVRDVLQAREKVCSACGSVTHAPPRARARWSGDGRFGVPVSFTPEEWGQFIKERL